MTFPHPNIVRRSDPYEAGKLICFIALWIVIVGGMLIERMQ